MDDKNRTDNHEHATPGRRPIPSIHLDRRFRTADVLSAIRGLLHWQGTPQPSFSSVVRAQELALASGAPTHDPFQKAILMPSVKGGIIIVFVMAPGSRTVTICEMNNKSTLWITGRDWTRGAERISHADAITRVRALR